MNSFDFKQLKKDWNALKVPTSAYQPNFGALANNKYNILMSERRTGKTTTFLLLGLLLHKRYGTTTVYIRATSDEVRPKDMKIYEVINTYDNGRYIKQITDGEYNEIIYYRSAFYYVYRNEDGDIEKKSEEICHVLTIDRNFDYKSSLNLPFGDWAVLDEFIGKPSDPIQFLDLLSTVFRDRVVPVVIMLSNTINSGNSKYFEEFNISKSVKAMKKGDRKEVTTSKGTHIYIEIIEKADDNKKSLLNSLFFGFDNPKIASITGEGSQVFAVEIAPHILKRDEQTDRRVLCDNIFIEVYHYEFLRASFCYNLEQGYHWEITRASEPTRENDMIFTIYDIVDRRYYYGIGHWKIGKVLLNAYDNHNIYYSTNEVASDFKNYLLEWWRAKRNW